MATEPGRRFLSEVREQPSALASLVAHADAYAAAARILRRRSPSIVRLVGHGSSDAAAAYAVYAFGLLTGWTAVRDSISLQVYYEADVDFRDSAVVALSQSGRTPDVIAYVARARKRGALTLAITNEPKSELAGTADIALPLAAGPETAVAASKTYLNTLAAVALLAGSCAEREQEASDGLLAVAELLAAELDPLSRLASQVALAFAYVGRMYVVGRGLEIATAREIALKLKETCRVAAEPVTATDLIHGPIAALDAMFPVWTIASRDASLRAVIDAAGVAHRAGATLVASGNAASEIANAAFTVPVPEPPLTVLSPLLSVVPGQLFAAALSRAKGLDADSPRALTKVTLAP